MDWYEDGNGNVMWQEGSDKTITKTYEGENGSITVNYRNVGSSYTVNVDNNVSIRYEQNEIDNVLYLDKDLKNINPQLSVSTQGLSFWENISSSNNIFAKIGYGILNDAYVTLQPLTFGLIGESRTNEFTGNVAFENLDGTTNYKGIDSATNTFATIFTLWAGKAGSVPRGISINKLNAAQFSHTFKGNLSRLQPATRGVLNRNLNKGISITNSYVLDGTNVANYTLIPKEKK